MASRKTKFKEGLFRAGGASHGALMKAYGKINQTYKDLDVLENMAFGDPKPGDTTTVMGHTLRNYGSRPQAQWSDEGKLTGFRFDWNVLNKPGQIQYSISSITVPEGWVAVPKHPGIYKPDPSILPEIAAALDALTLPDLTTLPEIMGTSPVITVDHFKGAYPRAYQAWPEVHIDYDRERNMSFVIDIPKNYKGRIFQPEGSTPMTQKQWWEFRSHYGDMYEPFGQNRPRGVTTPDDYKNSRKTNAKADYRYFLITGETLKIYNEFKARQKQADQAMSKLMRDWGSSGGVSYCGDELISTTFKKDPGKGWLRDDEGFKDTYKPDESVPEGLRLKEIFAQLPQSPNLVDLQAQLTPGETWMKFPMTTDLHDLKITVLAYPSKVDGKAIIPPPGALEIPSQVYTWMTADRSDKICGMKAPPMPPALRPAYDNFIATVKATKSSGPAPQSPGL